MDVTDAIKIIKKHGYKLTAQRKDLLTLFAHHDKYLTAKTVLAKIVTKYPNLSFDTIYRNLSLFADLGILEMTELSGEMHFRYTCDRDEHHHHFICLQCGRTKQIEMCPMDKLTEDLSRYNIEDHKFEIYGRCPICVS